MISSSDFTRSSRIDWQWSWRPASRAGRNTAGVDPDGAINNNEGSSAGRQWAIPVATSGQFRDRLRAGSHGRRHSAISPTTGSCTSTITTVPTARSAGPHQSPHSTATSGTTSPASTSSRHHVVVLAVATWRTNYKSVLLGTALFAAALATLGIAEFTHQIRASATTIAVIAAIITVLHSTAALLAEQRRASP